MCSSSAIRVLRLVSDHAEKSGARRGDGSIGIGGGGAERERAAHGFRGRVDDVYLRAARRGFEPSAADIENRFSRFIVMMCSRFRPDDRR